MTNFPSYARGPQFMGRKLVRETNCYDQVDFCPFRGPDAPFALRRAYHECRKLGIQFVTLINLPFEFEITFNKDSPSEAARAATLVQLYDCSDARTRGLELGTETQNPD
jgi:hypothetical protein